MAISWFPLGLLLRIPRKIKDVGRTTAGCITALFISLHRLCAFSFMSKNSPRPMTALCPCTGPEAQGSLTSGPSSTVCLSCGLVSSPKGHPKAHCRPCLLCVRQHVLVCYNKLAGLAGRAKRGRCCAQSGVSEQWICLRGLRHWRESVCVRRRRPGLSKHIHRHWVGSLQTCSGRGAGLVGLVDRARIIDSQQPA